MQWKKIEEGSFELDQKVIVLCEVDGKEDWELTVLTFKGGDRKWETEGYEMLYQLSYYLSPVYYLADLGKFPKFEIDEE